MPKFYDQGGPGQAGRESAIRHFWRRRYTLLYLRLSFFWEVCVLVVISTLVCMISFTGNLDTFRGKCWFGDVWTLGTAPNSSSRRGSLDRRSRGRACPRVAATRRLDRGSSCANQVSCPCPNRRCDLFLVSLGWVLCCWVVVKTAGRCSRWYRSTFLLQSAGYGRRRILKVFSSRPSGAGSCWNNVPVVWRKTTAGSYRGSNRTWLSIGHLHGRVL